VRRFVVGTKPPADILVTHDPYVSIRHAELVYFDQGAVLFPGVVGVKDLGSMNGTHVRRQGKGKLERVRVETLLSPGDELWLGVRTRFPWEQLLQRDPAGVRLERVPE
jgi:pSer/pThr/pTyr-binding forkhead associated (FHA) protein